MNPSHNTPAPDVHSEVVNYIYSHSHNLKLITNINTITTNLGYKPKTILSIINEHSKLTLLSCNNILAIRIKP